MRLLFFFLLLISASQLRLSQRNKEKHVLHPKLQQTLPGPLPLLVEAATSPLSLAKACMLDMPQDHLPVAPSDLQRNWFSLSQLNLGGFPCLVCLVPPKEGKQGLARCAAVGVVC